MLALLVDQTPVKSLNYSKYDCEACVHWEKERTKSSDKGELSTHCMWKDNFQTQTNLIWNSFDKLISLNNKNAPLNWPIVYYCRLIYLHYIKTMLRSSHIQSVLSTSYNIPVGYSEKYSANHKERAELLAPARIWLVYWLSQSEGCQHISSFSRLGCYWWSTLTSRSAYKHVYLWTLESI